MAFALMFRMKMGKKSHMFNILGRQRFFKIEDVIISEPFIITTWNFLSLKPFGYRLGMHKNDSTSNA